MSTYGIPYQGSKSKIAEEILHQLPSGKRLVDLFGGGFAITHCAMEKFNNKWDRFLYNDKNPLLKPLISDAINGKYSNNFIPEWISREDFFERKEKDGYIKWIWSFGNVGRSYIYSKEIENVKKEMHDLIVFDIKSTSFPFISLSENGFNERRLELKRSIKQYTSDRVYSDFQHLEGVARLKNLERLNKVDRLSTINSLGLLELKCMDYREYEYQEGDVVYCDIPYDDTNGYRRNYCGYFNSGEFFEWAKSRPFDVYYSEYSNKSQGLIVWQKEVITTMSATSNSTKRIENLIKL